MLSVRTVQASGLGAKCRFCDKAIPPGAEAVAVHSVKDEWARWPHLGDYFTVHPECWQSRLAASA
jgi:hypothetical protein